jgi:NAD(P)-dependent dehydrogenase (short-subunit alcohol dehydrogenase family)
MSEEYTDLIKKTVLVTGGSSGLGFAIARAFSSHGARVAIVGRDVGRLDAARKALGPNTWSFAFDLTGLELLPRLVEQVRDAAGEIDVLVNNAGVNAKKEAVSLTDEEFECIVRTNQAAVFALTREVGKFMVRRGSGNIIMISSMASQYGIPKVVGYSASKAAVEGMTRALAVEWGPFGVRVNCIAPGFVTTAMSSKALNDDPERKDRALARTPLGRLGDPEDVAEAALFLASEKAKFITGVVLPVDGGNSVGF